MNDQYKCNAENCGKTYAIRSSLLRYQHLKHNAPLNPSGPARKKYPDIQEKGERHAAFSRDNYTNNRYKILQRRTNDKLVDHVVKEVTRSNQTAEDVLVSLKAAVDEIVNKVDVDRRKRDWYLWFLGCQITRVDENLLNSLEPIWPYNKPKIRKYANTPTDMEQRMQFEAQCLAIKKEVEAVVNNDNRQAVRRMISKYKRLLYIYAYLVPSVRAFVSASIINSIVQKVNDNVQQNEQTQQDITNADVADDAADDVVCLI
jgi:hypothetical protein